MTALFALLIAASVLVGLYYLGYPLAWAVDKIVSKVGPWVFRKRCEWDSAYRR